MAQIRWLSELAIFSFDIKYRSGKLNQAADALSHHPKTENENFSDSGSDRYETISYTVICNDLSEVIKEEKLPLEIKKQFRQKLLSKCQIVRRSVCIVKWLMT